MKPQCFPIILVAALAGGCGGGGSDSAANDPPAAQPPTPQISETYRNRLNIVKTKSFNFSAPGLALDTIVNDHTVMSLGNNRLSIDMRSLPQGWLATTGRQISRDASGDSTTMQVRSYQGFYSGAYIQKGDEGFNLHLTYGVEPLADDMPSRGKATYTGVAFDERDKGTFTYHLDFAKQSGHGQISGLSRYGEVTLHPSVFTRTQLNDFVIFQTVRGRASSAKSNALQYSANVWGAGAQEINGKIQEWGDATAVFQGSRGDIVE